MPRLPEIPLLSNIITNFNQFRRETEEAWRQSEMELKADRYGYDLYLEMQAGKLTPKEFQEKIDRSKAEFGYDLAHVRYGAWYAKEYPPREANAKK